jgi:hypothetical protein
MLVFRVLKKNLLEYILKFLFETAKGMELRLPKLDSTNLLEVPEIWTRNSNEPTNSRKYKIAYIYQVQKILL